MTNKKKTKIDVLEAIIEMSMPEQLGPIAVQGFRQTVLPNLRMSADAQKELSDAEFEAAIAQIKKGASPFSSVADSIPTDRFPDLPPDWFSPSSQSRMLNRIEAARLSELSAVKMWIRLCTGTHD